MSEIKKIDLNNPEVFYSISEGDRIEINIFGESVDALVFMKRENRFDILYRVIGNPGRAIGRSFYILGENKIRERYMVGIYLEKGFKNADREKFQELDNLMNKSGLLESTSQSYTL